VYEGQKKHREICLYIVLLSGREWIVDDAARLGGAINRRA